MNTLRRRWKESALGLLVLAVLYACTVTGEGYVGGYYDPPDYEYGSWGHAYYVAPPRGEHREEHGEHAGRHANDRRPDAPRQDVQRQQPQPHAYRPAPASRPIPSLPEYPRER